MKGLPLSLGIVVLVVLGMWLVGYLAGFQMSLFSSLAISVGLTLVLNLLMRAFSRRRG